MAHHVTADGGYSTDVRLRGVAGGGGCTRPARRVDHLPLPGGARWGIV